MQQAKGRIIAYLSGILVCLRLACFERKTLTLETNEIKRRTERASRTRSHLIPPVPDRLISLPLSLSHKHTHARTHVRTHACTHTRTHARARTPTHIQRLCMVIWLTYLVREYGGVVRRRSMHGPNWRFASAHQCRRVQDKSRDLLHRLTSALESKTKAGISCW